MQTIWIIDGAYMLAATPVKIDYLKLKQHIEGTLGDPLYESYFLNSVSHPPMEAQNSFHNWLKSAPPFGPKMRVQLYDLKELSVVCPSCGRSFPRLVQKGVDVGIATLIIKLASQNRYDRLLLCAGDGDFEDAIDYVKSELHREIWICGFHGSMSADLQSYADRVIWLNDVLETIKKT